MRECGKGGEFRTHPPQAQKDPCRGPETAAGAPDPESVGRAGRRRSPRGSFHSRLVCWGTCGPMPGQLETPLTTTVVDRTADLNPATLQSDARFARTPAPAELIGSFELRRPSSTLYLPALETISAVCTGPQLLGFVVVNALVGVSGGCISLLLYPTPVCVSAGWVSLSYLWGKVFFPPATCVVWLTCRQLYDTRSQQRQTAGSPLSRSSSVENYDATQSEDPTFGLAKGQAMGSLNTQATATRARNFSCESRIKILCADLEQGEVRSGPYAYEGARAVYDAIFKKGRNMIAFVCLLGLAGFVVQVWVRLKPVDRIMTDPDGSSFVECGGFSGAFDDGLLGVTVYTTVLLSTPAMTFLVGVTIIAFLVETTLLKARVSMLSAGIFHTCFVQRRNNAQPQRTAEDPQAPEFSTEARHGEAAFNHSNFWEAYLRVQDLLYRSSVGWQNLLFVILVGTFGGFMVQSVLLFIELEEIHDSVPIGAIMGLSFMACGLLVTTQILMSVGTACSQVKQAVCMCPPDGLMFVQGGRAELLGFLSTNPLAFKIYGFELTPKVFAAGLSSVAISAATNAVKSMAASTSPP